MSGDERRHLDNIAAHGGYGDGLSDKTRLGLFDIFSPLIKNGATLEIGPAEGLATAIIAKRTDNLTLLEPTSALADNLQKCYPQTTVACELIEEYRPPNRFDNIFMLHVLEHVEDAVRALCKIKSWLGDGGRFFLSVPNAMSLHRQLGVLMGMLETEDAPSERDVLIGHRRVYTQESLRRDLESAGFSVLHEGGVWIKPGSNAQIKQWNWDDELLEAAVELGKKYPEIAAEICAVAE